MLIPRRLWLATALPIVGLLVCQDVRLRTPENQAHELAAPAANAESALIQRVKDLESQVSELRQFVKVDKLVGPGTDAGRKFVSLANVKSIAMLDEKLIIENQSGKPIAIIRSGDFAQHDSCSRFELCDVTGRPIVYLAVYGSADDDQNSTGEIGILTSKQKRPDGQLIESILMTNGPRFEYVGGGDGAVHAVRNFPHLDVQDFTIYGDARPGSERPKPSAQARP
jgi:hypothetical protein